MNKIETDKHDRSWLNNFYHNMTLGNENNVNVIIGSLPIDMVFQGIGKPYIINPGVDDFHEGERIEDEYQIKIVLVHSNYSSLPQVFETAGRIETIATEKGMQLTDFHFNPGSKSACLCVRNEENEKLPNGFNLPDFFHRLLIPFFYAQSYYEKFGTWPWGQYSHYELGLLEWYSFQINTTREETKNIIEQLRKYSNWDRINDQLTSRKGIKSHHDCICGSHVRYRQCHNEVLRGLWKLQRKINEYGIQI